jgi:hypothetical protein
MRIELQWAFTEADMRAAPCEICEVEFGPRAVIIRGGVHGEEACEECLRMLSGRKASFPGAPWPTFEEYEALVASHPEPMFASAEELEASEAEAGMDGRWPAYDASWLWRVPEEEDDVVHVMPTVLCRMDGETMAAAVAEGPEGGDRALVVFRSEEEADRYRAATGNHPDAEGWRPVALGLRELSDLLEIHGCTHVAMPEPWTGAGGVDFFAAADFIGMLEEAPA